MSYNALYLVNGLLIFGLFVTYLLGHRSGYVQGASAAEKRLPTHEYVEKLEEEIAEHRRRAFERWRESRRVAADHDES